MTEIAYRNIGATSASPCPLQRDTPIGNPAKRRSKPCTRAFATDTRFDVGARLRIVSRANAENYMDATVVASASGRLVVEITGLGPFAAEGAVRNDWNILVE